MSRIEHNYNFHNFALSYKIKLFIEEFEFNPGHSLKVSSKSQPSLMTTSITKWMNWRRTRSVLYFYNIADYIIIVSENKQPVRTKLCVKRHWWLICLFVAPVSSFLARRISQFGGLAELCLTSRLISRTRTVIIYVGNLYYRVVDVV